MARGVRTFDRTLLETMEEGVVPRPGLLTYHDWNSLRAGRAASEQEETWRRQKNHDWRRGAVVEDRDGSLLRPGMEG